VESNGIVRIVAESSEMAISAHAQYKIMANSQLKHSQIAQFPYPYLQEINAAENKRDNRFQTGSGNNGISAHAQEKWPKTAKNAF